MSKAKRKEITEKLGTESFYDILDQKTPQEVIAEMQAFDLRYAGRKVSFNVAPYGYDGGLELEVYEHRLETDTEFEKRCKEEAKEFAKEKKRKESKLDKEFAEYERLKQKFEGK